MTASRGGSRRLVLFAGATCTSLAASAGFAASAALLTCRLLFTTRKGKIGGGEQASEAKGTKDLLQLLGVHHPPPFPLKVSFDLPSQARKGSPERTQVAVTRD